MKVFEVMENDFDKEPPKEGAPREKGWVHDSKELKSTQQEVDLLIRKLDKLADPMDEVIRYKNIDIKDPNVNQDYAFLWYNPHGQLEAHEIIGMPDDKTRDYVKRIVARLRYLYTVENRLRREMKLK